MGLAVFFIYYLFLSIISLSLSLPPNSMRLILGSSSSSRKAILTKFGLSCSKVIAASIDERSFYNANPDVLVSDISSAKTSSILPRLTIEDKTGTVLLCGDSVVVHKGIIQNKPNSCLEASSLLHSYRENSCSVVSGMEVTNLVTMKRAIGVRRCVVHFGNIPNHIIDQLVEKGDVLNCAGALMVEHPLLQPYIRLEGELECAMGLSIELLRNLWLEITDTNLI